MKKKFLARTVLLSFLLSFLMLNLGFSNSMELTTENVKEIIAKKANEIIEILTSPSYTDLSESDRKLIVDQGAKVIPHLLVSGIKTEGSDYIVRITIDLPDMPQEPFTVSLNIKNGKSGWQILEVQVLDKQWISLTKAVLNIQEYVKGLLFKNKQKIAMGDISTIGKAIKNYMIDKSHAPKANSISELENILEPVYIKTLPLNDPFGYKYRYKVDKGNPKVYWIASGGSDGTLTGFQKTGFYIVYTFNDFAKDIIYSSGRFIYGPKTKKSGSSSAKQSK